MMPRIPGPVPFPDRHNGIHAHVVDGQVDTHRIHNSATDDACCPELEGPEMMAVAPSPYGIALPAPEAPIDIDADVPLGLGSAPPPDGLTPPTNPMEDELLRGMLGAPKPKAPLGGGF